MLLVLEGTSSVYTVSRPNWSWLDSLVHEWTVENPNPSRVVPILAKHSTFGFMIRRGALRLGRRDEEPEESRMRKFLTWHDLYVGWPTDATPQVKSGWIDVFEHRVDQPLYTNDIVGVSEKRSSDEAKGVLDHRVRQDRESAEADQRNQEAEISSGSAPIADSQAPLRSSVQGQGKEASRVISTESQGFALVASGAELRAKTHDELSSRLGFQ